VPRASQAVEYLTTATEEAVRLAFRLAPILMLIPTIILTHWLAHENEHGTAPSLPQVAQWGVTLNADGLNWHHLADAASARETLVLGYLRYALRLARKDINRGLAYEDLVQEAAIGLIIAADKFD